MQNKDKKTFSIGDLLWEDRKITRALEVKIINSDRGKESWKKEKKGGDGKGGFERFRGIVPRFRHRVYMASRRAIRDKTFARVLQVGVAALSTRSILLPREMQRHSIGFDGSHCPDSSTAVWILGMLPDLISDRSSGAGSARDRSRIKSIGDK